MSTPLMSTTGRSSHRNSVHSHHEPLTRFERILGIAIAAALAAVATLALLVPSASAAGAQADGPVVTAGQAAHGKATPFSSSHGDHVVLGSAPSEA